MSKHITWCLSRSLSALQKANANWHDVSNNKRLALFLFYPRLNKRFLLPDKFIKSVVIYGRNYVSSCNSTLQQSYRFSRSGYFQFSFRLQKGKVCKFFFFSFETIKKILMVNKAQTYSHRAIKIISN